MTIKVYQGERPSHTHENRMLDSFIEAVRPRWERSEDLLVLVSNAYWNQAEIDLVCILNQALVVIDFKAYSGRITVSENGPWMKGSVPVAGGSKQNPLAQVKHNKFSVLDWLRSRELLKHCNLGHISGAVVFKGQIEVEGGLPPKVSKWFSVIAIDGVAAYLQALASPEISIDISDVEKIVACLSVPEYLWAPHQIVNIPPTEEDADTAANFHNPPTDSQKSALETIERFVHDKESSILTVSGMTSTGKSNLIPRLNQLSLEGRSIVVLAPNRRLSSSLGGKYSLNVSSIYHHIYDTKTKPKKVKSEKGTIEALPIKADTADHDDCIYVIDDAHLITDTYFEPEPGKRFGSGRLVSDFLEYARLNDTTRKVVLLSDPYHVTQARATDQFPHRECWERHKLVGESITLSQLIRKESSGAILDNAKRLVHCIDEEEFSELEFSVGDGLEVMNGQDAADFASELIRSGPESILLIAYSNSDVSGLNQWARRQRFDQTVPGQVVPGDLLEIYSFVNNENPLESDGLTLGPGDLVIVESAESVQRQQQTLKGRDEPIVFSLQEVRLAGASHSVHLLIDFLVSESKEIEADIQIAAEVWFKTKELPQPVKARFGYAATAHHARGLRRSRTVVAPPKSIGAHNDAYFRWLYTAITRAEESTVVANWKPLHVFDKAEFNQRGGTQKTSIPIGAGLKFDPERPLGPEERDFQPPDGLDPQSSEFKETVAVWLLLLPVFDSMGLEVKRVQGHPYQVQFTLQSGTGDTCQLIVSYKGDHTISGLRLDDQDLLLELCERLVQKIQLNPDQRKIVSFLPRLPGLGDVKPLSMKPTDYRIVLIVGNASDGLAELELNHDGEGMVTSVRLLQFTDEKIVDRLAAALEVQD